MSAPSRTNTALPLIGLALAVSITAGLVGWLMGGDEGEQTVSPHPQVKTEALVPPTSAGGAAPAHPADESLIQIKLLEGILDQNPNDLEALLSIGYLYVQRQEYEKAHGYYLRASQVAPGNLEARTHLGTVAYFLGNVDEALHHYQQVLAVDPDYTMALFEMGAVLRYGKQDLPAAIATWERFLELDPDAEEADSIRALVAEARKMIETGEWKPPAPAAPESAPEVSPEDLPWPGEAAPHETG